MAEWNDNTKHPKSSINNGQQYTKDDNVTLESLNNTIENSFYAVRVAENAQSATNNAVSYNTQIPSASEQIQAQKNLGIDQTITFAESERQKSKNLCCLKNESATVAGVTMIYDSINQTIELNGTSTGDINIIPNIRNILPIISNSLGKTYSFTILKESGNFSENFGVYLGSLDSDIWSDRFTIWVNKGITVSSLTFTVSTNHTYDTLFVYLLKGTVVNNLKLKVQIEEGSVATNYQPYNGAIVHEKGIADVEHVETIYDMSSSDSNINWSKTSGIPLYDTLNIVHDFSGFKKYDFIYEPNTRSDNWYGSARTITVYDAIAGDSVFTYFDCVSPSSCYAENLGGMEIYTQFRMAYDKQSVTVISATINSDGNHSNIPSGYNDFYRLIKIVGYK